MERGGVKRGREVGKEVNLFPREFLDPRGAHSLVSFRETNGEANGVATIMPAG